MNPVFRRAFALVLILCLLIPMGVSAAVVTEDGHVINHPELLEGFEFPKDWSEHALRFCVGNEILKGKSEGLVPEDPTTRAETAAILVRLLGVAAQSLDLSRFADVMPEEWYYAEVGAAVEHGILAGTSETTMEPNTAVTREQAFTMISRAFGLYPENVDGWQTFTDSDACAEYARNAVAALRERGVVSGYPDGTLRPKSLITRAELAQLIYVLFTAICDEPSQLPVSGRVLYRGAEPIPKGYAMTGSLTVAGDGDSLTLNCVSIQKELTIRRRPGSEVSLSDCYAENLILSGQALSVDIGGDVAYCVVNGDGMTLTGRGSIDVLRLLGKDCDIQIPVGRVLQAGAWNPDDALKIVETLVVWDTVTVDTYLYSSSDLTGRIMDLPAGTKLDHYYYREGERSASVYTENGRFGWVDIDCISIPADYEIHEPYSTEVMEAFVNRKGYDSATGYLIWVSLKTQTVNVFTGKKGEWQLIRSMPCASGKNSTPTARGEFAIKNKLWEWDFGSYKVRYVSVFYGGYAFHSRIYNRSYSEMLDDAIGYPASDGCLRMMDEDCRYIMEDMPYNTRVVVY